ncbi:MAG: GlmU family protein [Cytophagales bacterium]|nr:GlmU family protein [Cytophagales bacterium]MDW8383235.1 GlmU family protein [Flammeovirgaceae bacterium]
MNIILFDTPQAKTQLLPFTFSRPVAHIRLGILTIFEKWSYYISVPSQISVLAREKYLQEIFPTTWASENWYIRASVIPDSFIADTIQTLPLNTLLSDENGMIVGFRTCEKLTSFEEIELFQSRLKTEKYKAKVLFLKRPWQIFQWNRAQIISDFKLITKGRKSQPISDAHVIVYGKENIFVEEGAVIMASILNASDAPIYIGKNAVVQEGSIIKGAFALCEGATVNMGAKMRGDTTVGPYSKVGGEISNSVIFGYSNKAHDGFLGNSVLGEWCNLGADTNTSNLKNNYSEVSVWSYAENKMIPTGLQFCGLFMGDHSKSSINTMFNTGTVVGFSANIFGAGFPPKHIPSFAWGGTEGFQKYELSKAQQTAEIVMKRRNVNFTTFNKQLFEAIYHSPYAFMSSQKDLS